MVQTRSMIKEEKRSMFIKHIGLMPYEIEKYIISYLEDDLLLNWADVISTSNYKKFKDYMNNGMGISFKSDKLIKNYYIRWIKSHRGKWLSHAIRHRSARFN